MTKPAGRDEGNLTEDSKIKILCSNYGHKFCLRGAKRRDYQLTLCTTEVAAQESSVYITYVALYNVLQIFVKICGPG